MDDRLKFFSNNGYIFLPNALTTQEVTAVNDGIDADRKAHPQHWEPSPLASGHLAAGCDAPELMHRTEALDGLAYHASVVPLVRQILGQGAQLSGLTYLQREPCDTPPPTDLDDNDPLCLTRVWHREDSGNVEGAEKNDFFTPALQAIYYLDDVDAESHCFSIIPESVETKRTLPRTTTGSTAWGAQDRLRIDDADTGYVDPERPTWIDAFGRELPRRIGRVDLHAKAGAAILFNNSNYHCGSIRQTQHKRRTLHVRYRQPEPVVSRHGLKQPWENVAQFTQALPSRPTIGKLP
ncbi:MAG: phytanoyl-CoA dioxygenase family protein [bacterium]|nr:phytanoyl-CoA dioxygenase family protein [bacterium]